MNVGDVMTQEVVSVTPETSVREVAEIMLKERISGLPVINRAHVLVGIVTEGDLLRRVESGTIKKRPRWLEFIAGPNTLASEYVQTHGRLVADVMSQDVAVATEEMALDAAVELMEKRRVKRLPVVRAGRVVGVLARANLLHALAASVPEAATAPSDKEMRAKLAHELAKHSWSARTGNIVVKNGVVDIWGIITDERQRKAIHVAAENVPGVKKIHDHLVWVEPFSGTVVDVGTSARYDIVQ